MEEASDHDDEASEHGLLTRVLLGHLHGQVSRAWSMPASRLNRMDTASGQGAKFVLKFRVTWLAAIAFGSTIRWPAGARSVV